VDLSGVDIKPTEGMVAVKFVDDDDDDAEGPGSGPAEPMPYEGLLAIVIGAGPKTSVKKGDTIVTKPYARDSLCLGDGVYLIENWYIAATIGK
jgi:hypothetical protein